MLRIPRNEFKDVKKTQITVFEIKINMLTFIARLLAKKLNKTVKVIIKILAEKSLNLFKIQSLVRFLSFCFQVVHLGQISISKL